MRGGGLDGAVAGDDNTYEPVDEGEAAGAGGRRPSSYGFEGEDGFDEFGAEPAAPAAPSSALIPPWYAGKLSREFCEEAVLKGGVGDFLVRESSKSDRIVICVNDNGAPTLCARLA